MKNKKTALLLYLLFAFIAPLLAAQNGTSCSNAYHIVNDVYDEYTFNEEEQILYFEFTSNEAILIADISPTSQSPFALIHEAFLFTHDGCGNISQVNYYDLSDSLNANHFLLNNLAEEQGYLLELHRDPGQGLPEAYFGLQLSKSTAWPCPPVSANCNEEIKNGDFNNYDPSVNLNQLFNRNLDAVCHWEDAFGNVDMDINNGNSAASLNYVNHSFANLSEGIITNNSFDASKTYVFSCSLKVQAIANSTLSEAPTEARLAILDQISVDNLPLPGAGQVAYVSDFLNIPSSNVNTYQIASKAQLGTTWQLFTFCFSPTQNFNSLVIYPYVNTIGSTRQSILLVDNVSIKEWDLDAGPNVNLNIAMTTTVP